MRISGLAFARIRDSRGRYALLLNRGRLRHNRIRILSPVGGGVELTPDGKAYLEQRFRTHGFERGLELRCRVPDDMVRRIGTWFASAVPEHREVSVLRELAEELVEETQLLEVPDLLGITQQFAGTGRHKEDTMRDVPEKQTCYLVDIFDVHLSAGAMHKLLAASRMPIDVRWIYFVTAEEIVAGVTNDGVTIGRISGLLVH